MSQLGAGDLPVLIVNVVQNTLNALAGTNGTPSAGNRFVTNSDPRLVAGPGGGGLTPSSSTAGGQIWSLRGLGQPENNNVKCGVFWNVAESYPANQLVEVFARFQADGSYIIADNDGGEHSGCLLGVDSSGTVTGNTMIEIASTMSQPSYGSGIAIRLGDLGVLGRVHTANGIFVYWKGVLIGFTEFSAAGVRKFASGSTASGILYFFGTDHLGKDANLVWARIQEGGTLPFPPEKCYAPSRSLAHNSQNRYGAENPSFNGMWDFTNPFNVNTIPDISLGREVVAGKGKVLHHGYLSDSIANRQFKDPDGVVTGVTPAYEQILYGQTAFTESVPTPPSGALVYDSHTRADITNQWAKTISPGTGELGGDWAGETQNAGIISKHLFFCEVYSPVWKVSPVTDYEVTYTRANSVRLRSSSHYESYCPKMIDADNFISVSFDPYGSFSMNDVSGRYGSGAVQIGTNTATGVGQDWSIVKFRFVGTQMQVYIGTTLVTTQTVPARWATATKAGLIDTTDNLRKLKSILIKAS